MRRLLLFALALPLAGVCCGASRESVAPSVQLAKSDFRKICEVTFQGRDLFDLAIEAGMYKRKGTEYLPGAERGAVSVRGRTWHGSNGVGLVAYDPHGSRYTIYYRQETAVPGHHLDIVYADEDFVFFTYGFHRNLPTVRPALEVYSVKRDCFARIDAVTSRGGKFGHFDPGVFAAKRPSYPPPAWGWDYRHHAEKEWVPLSEGMLVGPQRVTLRDGIFTLWFHKDLEDIGAFVTAIQFTKGDLDRGLEKISSNQRLEGAR